MYLPVLHPPALNTDEIELGGGQEVLQAVESRYGDISDGSFAAKEENSFVHLHQAKVFHRLTKKKANSSK